MDDCRREVCLAVSFFPALSTRDVPLISSSLKGGCYALVESATDIFWLARLSLIGGVSDHLFGSGQEITVEVSSELEKQVIVSRPVNSILSSTTQLLNSCCALGRPIWEPKAETAKEVARARKNL